MNMQLQGEHIEKIKKRGISQWSMYHHSNFTILKMILLFMIMIGNKKNYFKQRKTSKNKNTNS